MTIEDYKDINNPDNWDKELQPGSGCTKCKRFLNDHTVQTRTGKLLCFNCVIEILHSEAFYKYRTRDLKIILKILQGKKEKIAVEIYQSLFWIHQQLKGEDGMDRNLLNYLDLIVEYMGYSGHLLARKIRSMAFNILHDIPDYSFPAVLSRIESFDISEHQWQFGINIGLFLAEINPVSKKIQNFLQTVWNHPDKEARQFIQSNLINKNDVIYSPDLSIKMKEVMQLLNFELIDNSRNRVFTMDYSTHNDLFEFIIAEYHLDALKHFYKLYWENTFTLKNDSEKPASNKKFPVKRELAAAFTIIISNKDLFLDFYNRITVTVQKLFCFLVFTHSYQNIETLSEKEQIQIIKEQNYDNRNKTPEVTDKDYYICQFKHEYANYYNKNDKNYIYCDQLIIKYVKNYLEKPDILKLQYRESIQTPMKFNESGKIEQHLHDLPDFIRSQTPAFNRNGSISAAYLKKLINHFEMNEFYPGIKTNEFKYIRSTMFILYIQQYFQPALATETTNSNSSVFENLKASVKYFTDKPLFSLFILNNFLTYLHFDSFDYEHHLNRHGSIFETQLSQELKTIVDLLQAESWLLFDSLINHYIVEDLIFPIIEAGRGSLYFYTNSPYYFSGSREKTYVDAEQDIHVTFIPFLKCWFFSLASLGLVELAYSEPHNSQIQRYDKEYLSSFDGLKAIRLTDLGGYVFGKRAEPPAEQGQSDFKVIVDNTYLILYTKGKSSSKEYILENMAKKKRPGMYTVSYHSFIKNCSNLDQVQSKINQFKQNFCESPSPVWQEFFDTIINRYNQISSVKDYKLYKIENNTTLKKLFYSDPVLKKHSLRAEDHHVLIRKDKLNIVKKRLEKEGFVTDL